MRSLLLALCTFLSVKTFALTIDSVGVENNNGNQLIIHKVAPKETYYSIGRLYNVPPKEIISFNNNMSLNIGTLVKVPTSRPFATTVAVRPSNSMGTAVGGDIIEYKVGPRESLFAISRKFGTTVADIRELNSLSSNNLSIGQVLKIRQGAASTTKPAEVTVVPATPEPVKERSKPQSETVADPSATNAEIPAETPKANEKIKPRLGRLGVSERNEKGIAIWFQDENLDSTKMLALHRTAPIGTIIKVTNPMTDRITFVKVVGTFADNETTKDAIIVLTKATADQLGALDKRFLVNIDYGVPNE